MKYLGYSNGKVYEVLQVASYNKNIGLVQLPAFVWAVWCTFERIEAVNE